MGPILLTARFVTYFPLTATATTWMVCITLSRNLQADPTARPQSEQPIFGVRTQHQRAPQQSSSDLRRVCSVL